MLAFACEHPDLLIAGTRGNNCEFRALAIASTSENRRLTPLGGGKKLHPVIHLSRYLIPASLLVTMALLTSPEANAAKAFTQATVTQVENSVSYGSINAGATSRRAAAVSDIVRANNFLFTKNGARAELQYADGSVVRIGQNTVFSFEAASRTLALEKGTFVFYVPKGSGGGTIKTPSLTAGITGTVGKVSTTSIAIIHGEVTLRPDGRKVRAGYVARRNPDGSITISPFDMRTANDGKLMNFNGLLPGTGQTPAPTTKRPVVSNVPGKRPIAPERAKPAPTIPTIPTVTTPLPNHPSNTPKPPVRPPPDTRAPNVTGPKK